MVLIQQRLRQTGGRTDRQHAIAIPRFALLVYRAVKTNFVPNRVLRASRSDSSPLESLLPRSVRTTLTYPAVAFWSLSAFEQFIQRSASPAAYQMFVRSVESWSGTTLRRTSFYSVQLPKPSDATHSAKPMGDNPAAVADFLNLDN